MEKNELVELKNKIELLIKEKESPFDESVTKKIYSLSNQLLNIAHELDSLVKGKTVENKKFKKLFDGRYTKIKMDIDKRVTNGESFSRNDIRQNYNLTQQKDLDVIQVWMDKRYNRKIINGLVTYGYGLRKEKVKKTRNKSSPEFLNMVEKLKEHLNSGGEVNRKIMREMFPNISVYDVSRLNNYLWQKKVPCIKRVYGETTYKGVIV